MEWLCSARLEASSGPRTKGVPTNNQRGRGSRPCLLWGGLDKSRHIVPTALLVRVQCARKDLHKAVEGPSTRPIVPGPKQTRESTEGCSKCIVRKNNKLGKRIRLNKWNIYKSKNGTRPGVRRSKRPLSACHTRRKYSMETSHKSVKCRVC